MSALTRRGAFGDALRAEWTKLRTVRGWLIGLPFAGLMVVLFTLLQANGMHTGYCTTPNPDSCVTGHQYVATGPGSEAVADSYEFVAQSMTGNGTITARVTSLTGRVWAGPADEAPSLAHTRPGLAAWAKVGLLVTPSTTQGSPYAAVTATGAHGVRWQYNYTHDSLGLPGAVSGSSPRWVRLSRTGDTLTGYDSANGITWTRIGTADLAGLPQTVDVGLFATSPVTFQGSATRATASFDHVAIDLTGRDVANGNTGTWQGHSIGTGRQDFYTTLGEGGYRRTGGSFIVSGSGDIAPAIAVASGDTASDSLLFGLTIALVVLIVVATMFITGEYRHGLIRTTFAATPARGRVLAAKAVAIGAAGFITGAAAAAAAIPLGEHLMSANGNYIFPAGALTVARLIVGSGALVAVTAMAVIGIGAILRRSAGAIAVAVIVFVLPILIGPGVIGPPASSSAATWLYTLTPAAGFSVLGALPRSGLVSYPYTMANGYYPLPPWGGMLVLCAYAAAALAVATFLLRRRDA